MLFCKSNYCQLRWLYTVKGSYDKCVHTLRESNKDNMAAVTAVICSHAQVAKKNVLITALIVSLFTHYITLKVKEKR